MVTLLAMRMGRHSSVLGRRVRLGLLGLLLSAGAGCNPDAEGGRAAPGPAPVGVAVVQERAVPNRFEFLGTVEAVQRVELRARVRGYITRIGFEEGAVVEENQILYEVDTRPFLAERRAAAAAVRRTQAQLDEAQRQLQRERELRAAGVNAAEDVETAQANVDALAAQVGEQRAELEQAKLEVGYSKLRAPFRGRIGERLVDVGELVGEGDSTLLAVVVQEDPMFIRFSPTERERGELVALDAALETPPAGGGAPVQLTLSDGQPYASQGRLTFVDNALNASTRSLTYKAVVDNPDRRLKPGESVTVSLQLPTSERRLIPSVAVASVQDIDYVYVVDDDSVARYREIEVGDSVGSDRIVLEGLEVGERVVVRGIQRVTNGGAVEVQPAEPGPEEVASSREGE